MYGLKIGGDHDNPDYTIHAGTFLRWNDAIIPVLKLDYNPFSVSISYDVNISKLKPSSYGRGGYEISISYIGFRENNSALMLCVAQDLVNSYKGGTGLSSLLMKLNTNAARRPPPKQATR
jgi:hypothetical protein